MTSIETLNFICQQLNVYMGISMFIVGTIGSLWNVLVFRHYTFRSSSCCMYMLFGSNASLIQLIFGLFNRILSDGFQMDWTVTSTVWCKIRNYMTFCASLTALTCFVWTAVDRLMSTSRQIKWRRLNSTHIAKYICTFTVIFWMIIGILTLVYTIALPSKRTCASSSVIWSIVSIYFINLFCYGIFPWFFMSVFGLLTLRNIRTIRRRRVQPLPLSCQTRMTRINNQLTSMLFLQIILSVLSSLPYCVQNLYDYFTQSIPKSEYRQAQEYLFLQIVRLTFYLNYTSMFYVNYLSSPIFRHLSKKVAKNFFKKTNDISTNITIINHRRKTRHSKANQVQISTICRPYVTSRV